MVAAVSFPLVALPELAIELIFSYLPHPQAFALVNRALYELTRTTHLRALWFLGHWGRARALSRAAIESTLGAQVLSAKELRVLIRRGADISVDGHHIVQYAAEQGYVELLDALLRHHDVPQEARDRALMAAANVGNMAVTQLALHHGANINCSQAYPLRYASYNLNLPLVRMLLRRGADPATLDNHALHLCTQPVRRFLLSFAHSTYSPPDLRELTVDESKYLGELVRLTAEIMRWLVWFGASEVIATRALNALDCPPETLPLDASGSWWFVTQPPRIVVTPPPNPLMAGVEDMGQDTTGLHLQAPMDASPTEAEANMPGGVPTAPTAEAIAATETTVALDTAEGAGGSEEEEEEIIDLMVEGMTEKLGTIFPWGSGWEDAEVSSGAEVGPVAAV